MGKNNKKIRQEEKKIKNKKVFSIFFLILVSILSIGFVEKMFQNDTFYTIKIGELILQNGIDMLDHFSYHTNLAYTYPHWLYDVFIYLIYKIGGYSALYISSIVIFIVILILLFITTTKISKNYSISAFSTLMCVLALSTFVTARAQLVSYLIFVLEIYFIESFLKERKKRYIIGLLILSLILCNIHVAVWPFYFILYLPYLAEFIVSFILSKVKKENKILKILKNKFELEKNENIKYLFVVMILSLFTGLITPIGDTPYTYLIKTMMGNSQSYIIEHQMLSWLQNPFTIIIAIETIFLTLISKVKLRDFFMICGLVMMAVTSTRHISLLALIGCICFARIFSMFLEKFSLDFDNKIQYFFNKKIVMISALLLVSIVSLSLVLEHSKDEYVNTMFYPVDAVKYIKENIDVENMRILNEYTFGSYLLLNDIPVFIDSRADLYTKEFSGLDYDIFDDFINMPFIYKEKFDFYGITHILLYKDKTNSLYNDLEENDNYITLYEDDYFVLYERDE